MPFQKLIALLGTILALAQLPSFDCKNVLARFLRVSAGLVVYALRGAHAYMIEAPTTPDAIAQSLAKAISDA